MLGSAKGRRYIDERLGLITDFIDFCRGGIDAFTLGFSLALSSGQTKTYFTANSIDPDETAQNIFFFVIGAASELRVRLSTSKTGLSLEVITWVLTQA